MNFKRLILIMASSTIITNVSEAKAPKVLPDIKPSATWTYAVKDGQELKMDYYKPAKGAQTTFEGKRKPTILFMFGGGFCSGERSGEYYLGYFDGLTKMGYDLVSIDYRLGMKDKDGGCGLKYFNIFKQVIEMATEDLFSATAFLIDNQKLTGVDADNLVLCGSSAGAIMALQGAWFHNIGKSGLPAGYSYKGVMEFSGGVISKTGKPVFSSTCPILLMHGTADKVVEYNKIQIFKMGFFGSNAIAKCLKKSSTPYFFYRYDSYCHEISAQMQRTLDIQDSFIKRNVIRNEGVTIDALMFDNSIERWKLAKTSEIYEKKEPAQ